MNKQRAYALMRQALALASHSPDPNTQNAAILASDDGEFLAFEVNEFPWLVAQTDERWERPTKYFYVEHAERNVLYSALRNGVPTKGNTIVCPWAACADCARGIIQSGIATLIRLPSVNHGHWEESCRIADEMFAEAGVKVIELTEPLGEVTPIRRDNQLWKPE